MIDKFSLSGMIFPNNTTSGSIDPEQAAPMKHTPYPWLSHPLTLAFIVLSIIGNIGIFSLVCLSKTFRRPSNYLIANLCVCSVYFILCFVHFNIRQSGIHLWEYDSTTCAIVGIAQRLPIPVLPYTLLCISLDRSKVARNPLDHASNRTILAQIFSIWFFGFLIVSPRIVIQQYDPAIPGWYKCKKVPLGGHGVQALYALFVLTVVYLIPTFILIKEFVTLRSKMRFLTLSQKKRCRHRLRLMQNSLIFTGVFVIAWLPFGVLQFPLDLELTDNVSLIKLLLPAVSFFRVLALLITCLNPILLLLLSFDVREYIASCSLV